MLGCLLTLGKTLAGVGKCDAHAGLSPYPRQNAGRIGEMRQSHGVTHRGSHWAHTGLSPGKTLAGVGKDLRYRRLPAARQTSTLSLPADAGRCLKVAQPLHCQRLWMNAGGCHSHNPHTVYACGRRHMRFDTEALSVEPICDQAHCAESKPGTTL